MFRRKGRRGYTLVALLVGVTALAILHAAILPLASAQAQRDREAELIFRGLQYAEGIRIFRRRFGRYPNNLKEMVELKPRTLRKLWKDPMTNSEDWGLVTLTGAPPPGGGNPDLGGKLTPTPTPPPGASGEKDGRGGFGQPPGAQGPVMGVYSRSTKKGFRTWEGRQAYNEWRFTEQSLASSGDAPSVGIPSVPTRPPRR